MLKLLWEIRLSFFNVVVSCFQNSFEAQFLVNQVQLYYGGGDEAKLLLLNRFTFSPDEFNQMDLIDQLEKIDLSVLGKGGNTEK